MKTIMIKDLSLTEELDRKAMASVHGGMVKGSMPSWVSVFDITNSDVKFDASQLMSQTQDTFVNNGNNVAFASGIRSTVNPHQTGANTINFV